MAESGITGLENRAAGAYAYAEAFALPVRAVSPAQQRQRFDLGDLAPAARRPAGGGAERVVADQRKANREPEGEVAAPPRRDTSRGYAFTAFLAQAIAQEDEADTPPPSVFQAGSQAYSRNGQDTAGASPRIEVPRIEVIAPFPRLASGRALDLSV